MTGMKRAYALALAFLFACGICACGSGLAKKADDSGMGPYEVSVDKPFEGFEAQDDSYIDVFVDKANALAQEKRSAVDSKAEDGDLTTKANSDFNAANDAYRIGNFSDALDGYQKALDTYPLHFGANVNLTLTYLQLEQPEEALEQALACVALFSDEPRIYLNAQAAGTAYGFSNEAISKALLVLRDDYKAELEEADLMPFWEYNEAWNSIEVDLHDAAAGDSDANDSSGRDAYQELVHKLTRIEIDSSDDSDVAALHAYLYQVGLQLGYEIDPTLVRPAKKLPITVADDDLCTIKIMSVEREEGTGDWYANIEMTNKSKEFDLTLEPVTPWTVNDTQTNPWMTGNAAADSTLEARICLAVVGEVSDEELTMFRGVLKLSSGESELMRYPVSWAEAEEE